MVLYKLLVTDDNPDRPSQNRSPLATGTSRSQARPLLGVRSSRSSVAHGNVCAHCSLARLHLVCDRKCRASSPEGPEDRMARWPRWADEAALRERHWRTNDQVEVHYSALLYSEQSDERWVWQRIAQHEYGESVLHLRHADRMWVHRKFGENFKIKTKIVASTLLRNMVSCCFSRHIRSWKCNVNVIYNVM